MAKAATLTAPGIPLSSPDITQTEIDAVVSVLRSAHLSLGPKVGEFERRLAEVSGRRFAVAVNSGTSALHLAVKALGLGDFDRVVTTPFSFVASANCLLMERCTPVFVDVDPIDCNIDVDAARQVVLDAAGGDAPIRGILGVDVFGRPARWDELTGLAAEQSLVLIEDACEAIGASYRGRPAGSFGKAAVFGFYPNKQITTGEGGAVVTDDEQIAALCSSLRNQGRDDGMAWLNHTRLGYNYRLSDINCALGLAQLERLDEILAKRKSVADMYRHHLAGIEDVRRPAAFADGEVSWFVYVVMLSEGYAGERRDEIIRELRARGIGAAAYFPAIHLQPFYSGRFGYTRGQLPVTESLAERALALPFHANLTEDDVRTVVANLKELMAR